MRASRHQPVSSPVRSVRSRAWLVLACLTLGAMSAAVSWAEPGSLSDSDRSTAANDSRPSVSFSARKNPQHIPANTPPVFPNLQPRIWPHLLRLVTNGNVGQVSSNNHPSARFFQVGEQLTYEISWLNITAGTAVMAVSAAGTDGDRPLAKLITTAQSRPVITKFFPVDNRVESIVDPATLLPEHLTFKRREGKKKEDIEYTFHQKKGTVTVIKGGTTETLEMPPGTQDVISCLYYARNVLSLQPGSVLTMNVHHDKKNRKLDVRVEEIETISGPWGKVETARVLVVMPFQGIFLNRGNIRVWFTNDDRRIPVRMKAKVIIGSIVADLVSGLQAASPIQ